MWPRFFKQDGQRSDTDTPEYGWTGKEQQSSISKYWDCTRLTSRAISSHPAQRRANKCDMRVQNRGLGEIESQENNTTFESNDFLQNQSNYPERSDHFVDLTSLLFGGRHSPDKEAFKKHCFNKEENCAGVSYSSAGDFTMKRKLSPNYFNFTEDAFHGRRKKFCSYSNSPSTSSYSPGYGELPNTSNIFLESTGGNVTSLKASKFALKEICYNENFPTTPIVKTYPSQDHFDWESKENLPSSFLSPESLKLQGGRTSSPESVYEKIDLSKDPLDEDVGIYSPQTQMSPRRNLFNKSPFFMPISPSHKDEWMHNNSVVSQFQPVEADHDEEYSMWISKSRTPVQ